MHPKLKVLKEVMRQMQCAMAEGHGDDEEMGEEVMESLAEGGEGKEEKVAEEVEEEEGLTKEDRQAYMKKSGALPSRKGSGMVMMKLAIGKPKFGGKRA